MESTAERRRGLIPEDLMNFRWLEEIVLAPDGGMVAWSVREPDGAANGYRSHLYIRDLTSAETQRLTRGPGQVSSLAWSRDGAQLAWCHSKPEGCSLRIWRKADGSKRGIPLGDEPLTGLDWAPDGIQLAGVRWTEMKHPDESRGPLPGVPKPNFKVVRRLRYKQDGIGWVHDRFSQVYVLDTATGDLAQVTHSECDYATPKWSMDGTRLAFVGTAREQNIAAGQGHIYLCGAGAETPGSGPRPLLPDWQGTAVSPVWGADDRYIAFAGHNHPPPTNRRNFWQPHLADVEAGTAVKLDEDIDEEVGNYGVADQRVSLTNVTVKWAPGDKWIYFLLTERGAANLWRIDTAGVSERLLVGECTHFEYSPACGDVAAYGVADPSNPGDLYLWRDCESERLTDLNPWLRDISLSAPESYEFAGVDDAPVHAWLIRPLDYDPQRSYPLVLYLHCSMFCWDFNHEFQIYANSGFAVAYFNQRGTTAGYGQAWTRATEGDQGGDDFDEIMLGVDDLLRKHPWIDGKRMGATGGSCGGYLTNWIAGHTDRFAATVAQRSIVNNISMFGTSDIGPECSGGETGSDPWSDVLEVWRQSPVAYIKNFNAPMLIVHSDADHRTDLEQAEQLFAALRWHGKPVEMVIFEGENHGLSRGGRPGNRIERLHRIQDWFFRYLSP